MSSLEIIFLCRQLNSTSSSLQRKINFSVPSSENVVFAFADGDLTELAFAVRHFEARKLHHPPLLSGNLSQNTSISLDFGYDCRSVLNMF